MKIREEVVLVHEEDMAEAINLADIFIANCVANQGVWLIDAIIVLIGIFKDPLDLF